jgi:hypothetical protein
MNTKSLNHSMEIPSCSGVELVTGSAASFNSEIGVRARKMATVIDRAKKLKCEGHFLKKAA